MDHPPQVTTDCREDASQCLFEGFLPVQMPMIVKELVACDTEGKKALADASKAVQEVTQGGPNPFYRVTVDANAIWVTAGVLTCSVVDGAMLVPSLGVKVVDVVLIGEEF
jgi:hypothetical protein